MISFEAHWDNDDRPVSDLGFMRRRFAGELWRLRAGQRVEYKKPLTWLREVAVVRGHKVNLV